jgi:hypothetical protein
MNIPSEIFGANEAVGCDKFTSPIASSEKRRLYTIPGSRINDERKKSYFRELTFASTHDNRTFVSGSPMRSRNAASSISNPTAKLDNTALRIPYHSPVGTHKDPTLIS